MPAIVGLLLALVILSKRREEHSAVLAGAFALAPIILFNQQFITGVSLQPYHYELFVANYMVLASAVIILSRYKRILLYLALLCLLLGVFEMTVPSMAAHQVAEDQLVPALKELDKYPGGVVFSPDIQVMRMAPTWSTQGTLLDIGGVDFGRIGIRERKERLFAYIYYSNMSLDETQVENFSRSVCSKRYLWSRTDSVVSRRNHDACNQDRYCCGH